MSPRTGAAATPSTGRRFAASARTAGRVTALALASVLAFTACAAVEPEQQAGDASVSQAAPTLPSIVTTPTGRLLGYTDDGVHTFRGIRYATAERFHRAEPTPAWTEVKPALVFGPTCPQSANDRVDITEFVNFSGGVLPQNEDCLFLNVWTPSVDAGSRKPVILWIHGGGYATGASNELAFTDGRNLAATGEAVFVSANHRLNVLGYSDLSAAGDQYADSANLGQLDLVEALIWVRDNIAAFGGDPRNVTIMGQSGGGGKVLSLLGMPAAEGLFHRAIAMSPLASWRDAETARSETEALYASAGVSPGDVAGLAAMPYLDLLAAAQEARFAPTPVTDTAVLPAPPVTPGGGFAGPSRDVPLIVSTVLGEFASNVAGMTYAIRDPDDPLADVYPPELTDERIEELLAARYGDRAGEITAAFAEAYPGHAPHEVLWIEDGGFFGDTRVLVSEARARDRGAAPVFAAVTAQTLPVFGGVTPLHTGGDVPFWLRNADKMGHVIAGEEATFFAMEDAITAAVLQFARTGDPGTDTLSWPAYSMSRRTTMVFDTESGARDQHEVELYRLLAEARAR